MTPFKRAEFMRQAFILTLAATLIPTPAFAVTFSRSVGIGTAATSTWMLNIAGTFGGNAGNTYLQIYPGVTPGGYPSYRTMSLSNNTNATVHVDHAGGITRFGTDGGQGIAFATNGASDSTRRLIITSSGEVMISTPQGYGDSVCMGIDGGTLLYKLGYCGSDARIKHGIQYLPDGALDTILQLKPANFLLNSDPSSTVRAGFIAQDTKEVIPEAVPSTSPDGMYRFDYNAIVAYTVKALQELHARLQGLNDRLASLSQNDKAQDEKIRQLERDNEEMRLRLNETVGSPNRPAGFTMYDMKDGRPHCVYLIGGNLIPILGTCEQTDAQLLHKSN